MIAGKPETTSDPFLYIKSLVMGSQGIHDVLLENHLTCSLLLFPLDLLLVLWV